MKDSRSRKQDSPSASRKSGRPPRKKVQVGQRAKVSDLELRSYEVGALPLVNHILERLKLLEILAEKLPPDDPRAEFPTSRAVLVLVRNVLLSRQPLYGVPEWAAQCVPELLELWDHEVSLLHDDRMGRSLQRLFHGLGADLIMGVVRHAIREFDVSLDELHNDSTTISFYGAYEDAAQEGSQGGRPTHAITWGHSKDHRPDLKQLLYTLTITEDGGVPVYFTSASGNVVDDRTHCQTWDLLRDLVGRPDFLYVADCKLASEENLAHLATRGGRFVTVMPRTHKEDATFRARLRGSRSAVRWQPLYDVLDEKKEIQDRFSTCAEEMISSGGYRIFWYHSARKAEGDAVARNRRLQRATGMLADLRTRLEGSRTRFRQRSQVEQAIARILEDVQVESWMEVKIEERPRETYHQEGPGRPNEKTRYVKETRPAYTLAWELLHESLAESEREDGVFPLLTNDRTLSAEQVLRAYKRQPLIEKRFSQFKSDFAVAPVYLKNVARIQGLLAVYFLVLLTQTLLERELRLAMARAKLKSLPIYPEGRRCMRPTMHRIVELFEPVKRYIVRRLDSDASPPAEKSRAQNPQPKDDGTRILATTLTPAQRQLVELLGLNPTTYGL